MRGAEGRLGVGAREGQVPHLCTFRRRLCVVFSHRFDQWIHELVGGVGHLEVAFLLSYILLAQSSAMVCPLGCDVALARVAGVF